VALKSLKKAVARTEKLQTVRVTQFCIERRQQRRRQQDGSAKLKVGTSEGRGRERREKIDGDVPLFESPQYTRMVDDSN
jgi:hypothetical protein